VNQHNCAVSTPTTCGLIATTKTKCSLVTAAGFFLDGNTVKACRASASTCTSALVDATCVTGLFLDEAATDGATCVACRTFSVAGTVSGIEGDNKLVVSIGTALGDAFLATRTVSVIRNDFLVEGLNASGSHFIKLEGTGYTGAPSRLIPANFSSDANVQMVGSTCVLTFDLTATRITSRRRLGEAPAFSYHWETDASRGGAATAQYIVKPPVIEFQNETLSLADDQAAGTLYQEFAVVLAEDNEVWSSEYASRLLVAFNTVPSMQGKCMAWNGVDYTGRGCSLSRWTLSKDYLQDDIVIITNATSGERRVQISSKVFAYATPQVVKLDGVRGAFFSKRLHNAVVRFITAEGLNRAAVEFIMSSRFGCSVAPITNAGYLTMTARTTAEDGSQFQPWSVHPEEPLLLLSMFEELPNGFHVIKGLDYIVRRGDGYDHPLYPTAPAVAWALYNCASNSGYIEFMESGFTADIRHLRRLILHEKAHLMWACLFSQELRAAWIKIAGWYVDAGAESGWSTTEDTTFVSAYAHLKNPNEDMAESISYYVENPAKLQVCEIFLPFSQCNLCVHCL